ncbi:MAG: hypothetical protein JW928_01630, partial [Candidatus Aureabacteria bacterium]|nr:hypothetical protein [Candidatus Auribacterota bacterium]
KEIEKRTSAIKKMAELIKKDLSPFYNACIVRFSRQNLSSESYENVTFFAKDNCCLDGGFYVNRMQP